VIKLSDYIARRLAEWGVRHVFMVSGGGAMHLNDSLGHQRGIDCVCTHHEQAAAMAAEGYARVTGQPGVINVTTGPGGINALNGVFGAWTDSIPMLVISGQVKRETCLATYNLQSSLRQLGDQEADILTMVRGITKYAALVNDPQSIRHHLEHAWHLAQTGRPGPCWLDIPTDVQSSKIDEATLDGFEPGEDSASENREEIQRLCREIVERITKAKRPVILAGTGVRLAQALPEFHRVIRRLRVPVTTGWTHDLIESDDQLFCGRPGTIGERAGNFTVQNADFVLVVGSRLNVRQVSYNWRSFAPRAFKVQVDVDPAELHKPMVKADMPIQCDAKIFLEALARELEAANFTADQHGEWLKWCRERVSLYPVVQEKQRHSGPPLNPYGFMEELSAMLAEGDVVVSGNASACILPFQVMKIKKGQRLFSNSGSASMGYDLPAAIGAAFARGGERVICLAGDGSLQMNIQELQTVVHHRIPLKIFVLNNGGYLSIRSTQANFFGRCTGESPASGVSFPDYVKIACAYGIPGLRVERMQQMGQVRELLATPGPTLFDVMLDPAQEFEPRCKSKQLPDGQIVSPPLEDMYPFLPEDELRANTLADEA
jgi:acetolactate synthase I/II/III large subunit